jgi:glycosyltransferase involved in cell wall biosynthesis
VIHEAFLAGIPVVAAAIGGIVDLVEEGRTGLLYDPTSSSALREALRRVVDDRALLDHLSGHARAMHVKSIVEDAREWAAIYEGVLMRRRAVQPV